MDSSSVGFDTVTKETTFSLEVGPDTLWVAGQEMMTSTFHAFPLVNSDGADLRRS